MVKSDLEHGRTSLLISGGPNEFFIRIRRFFGQKDTFLIHSIENFRKNSFSIHSTKHLRKKTTDSRNSPERTESRPNWTAAGKEAKI